MQPTWKTGRLSNPQVQLTCIATLGLLSKPFQVKRKRAAGSLKAAGSRNAWE